MLFHYQNVFSWAWNWKKLSASEWSPRGEIWEAVTLLGTGGDDTAEEDVAKESGELSVKQGNVAGNLGGKVMQDWGLDGSCSTGPEYLVWSASSKWNPYILESSLASFKAGEKRTLKHFFWSKCLISMQLEWLQLSKNVFPKTKFQLAWKLAFDIVLM